MLLGLKGLKLAKPLSKHERTKKCVMHNTITLKIEKSTLHWSWPNACLFIQTLQLFSSLEAVSVHRAGIGLKTPVTDRQTVQTFWKAASAAVRYSQASWGIVYRGNCWEFIHCAEWGEAGRNSGRYSQHACQHSRLGSRKESLQYRVGTLSFPSQLQIDANTPC